MNTKKELKQGLFIPIEQKIGASLTRRTEVIWIEANASKEDINKILKENPNFSSFPVCSGTFDSVIGVLNARLFYETLYNAQWTGLKDLVTKPVFLPETTSVAKALAILKEHTCKLAFVIDEYGGVEGIITQNGVVNDLLETIKPEEQKNASIITKREDASWLVDAQARIDDITRVIPLPDLENSDHDYFTLAGYILAINENIPKVGDSITYKNLSFEIMVMDGNRIDRVLICLLEPQAGQAKKQEQSLQQ